jgi:hypothetical protein
VHHNTDIDVGHGTISDLNSNATLVFHLIRLAFDQTNIRLSFPKTNGLSQSPKARSQVLPWVLKTDVRNLHLYIAWQGWHCACHVDDGLVAARSCSEADALVDLGA